MAGYCGGLGSRFATGLAGYQYENYPRVIAFKLGGKPVPLPPRRVETPTPAPPPIEVDAAAAALRRMSLARARVWFGPVAAGLLVRSGFWIEHDDRSAELVQSPHDEVVQIRREILYSEHLEALGTFGIDPRRFIAA